MRSQLSILRDQRGFALPFGAVSIGAILAFAGLGVGMGQMYTVLSEMQNAADAGALAGAEALFQGDSPTLEARAMVTSNIFSTVAGGSPLTDANIVSITTGNYAPATGYRAGIGPENAVEVITNETMPPILSGQTIAISARSVAAVQGESDIPAPPLPLVIGACRLPEDCYDDSCMPQLSGAGGRNLPQTGWTTYGGDPSSLSSYVAIFASDCPVSRCAGSNDGTGSVQVREQIALISNSHRFRTELLNCVKHCLWNRGVTRIQVPVVPCESFSAGTGEITGFATFDIVAEPSADTGLVLQGRVADPGSGGGGGAYFGTGVITLVE